MVSSKSLGHLLLVSSLTLRNPLTEESLTASPALSPGPHTRFPLAPIPLKVQTRCKPPPPLMWAGSVYTSTRANKRQTDTERSRKAGRSKTRGKSKDWETRLFCEGPQPQSPLWWGPGPPGGRTRTDHPFANRLMLTWAFGQNSTCTSVSQDQAAEHTQAWLRTLPTPGAGDRDTVVHLLTFVHLSACMHYPENCVPAQCMAFHVPFHPKVSER